MDFLGSSLLDLCQENQVDRAFVFGLTLTPNLQQEKRGNNKSMFKEIPGVLQQKTNPCVITCIIITLECLDYNK